MTAARWLVLAAATLTAVALSGCTQQSAGSPMPDDTVTTGTEPSNERPQEIKLDGKDPCGQIPQSDWPKFGIEGPGKPSEHPDFKSPQCYYRNVGNVALVVTEGIEAQNEVKYNVEIEDAEPIDGYRTITVASNIDRRACWAVVDVADGYLMTTVAPDPNDPSNPERCDLAYQLAESAMQTLVAS